MTNTFKKYNTYDLSGEFGKGYTSKGEEFYFDLEDYELIKNHNWHESDNGYCMTNLNKNLIRMHRLIMDFPDDMQIDHINRNRKDKR